jgi:glycosyltransferase involved in cell wall biosynthesis
LYLEERYASDYPASTTIMANSTPIRIAVYSLDLPHYACAELRINAPLRHLSHKVECQWAVHNAGNRSWIDASPIDWADLILVQRYFPLQETWPVLEGILKSEKPVVYDIDDILMDIAETHPLYDNFQRTIPFIRDFLPRADIVTVTTDRLRDQLLEYNPNTVVIPNFINESAIVPTRAPEYSRETTIAFMGTPSHTQDLELIEDVLFKLKEKFTTGVRFIFWGCAGTRLEKLGPVLPFEDNYASFLKKLGETHFDIGLAPLADTLFNRCKSNIKWLEYSAYGRAGIFSDLDPYRHSVKHGQTGMLAGEDAKEWLHALDYLVTHPTERMAMGRAARKDAFARFGLTHGAQRYLELFSKLVQR